jgi:hypothetical protein
VDSSGGPGGPRISLKLFTSSSVQTFCSRRYPLYHLRRPRGSTQGTGTSPAASLSALSAAYPAPALRADRRGRAGSGPGSFCARRFKRVDLVLCPSRHFQSPVPMPTHNTNSMQRSLRGCESMHGALKASQKLVRDSCQWKQTWLKGYPLGGQN